MEINDWLKARKATPKDTLVNFGSAVKSTDDKGGIGGHVVLFGSPSERDLYGDYFSADTDFDLQPGQQSAVYYQHGFDYHFKSQVLSRATLGADDVGIWIDAQLDIHDEYMEALNDLIDEGIMGWSSGTAGHLVELERRGKAWFIKRWPLGLDASITPSPADPRQVNTLRSLKREWARQYPVMKTAKRPFFFSLKTLAHRSLPETPAETVSVTVRNGVVQLSVREPQIETRTEVREMPEANTQAQTATPENTALAALEAQMKAQGEQINQLLQLMQDSPAVRSAGYFTQDGGEADKRVRSFGDFVMAIARDDAKRLKSVYGSVKALSEDSGPSGGYLVPVEFRRDLLQLAAERAIVRSSGAFIQPMAGRQVDIPVLDQNQTPPTNGSAFFGGVNFVWTEEGGTYQNTEPKFEMMTLIAHKLAGSTKASKEMLADAGAVGVEALLRRLFGEAIAWIEDFHFLRGNGVGKPQGVVGAPATISVTRNAGGNAFEFADIQNMVKRLPEVSAERAVWVMHSFLKSDVIALQQTNNSLLTFLQNLNGRPQWQLLGNPIRFTEKLPAPGSDGDVLLCDFGFYVVGDNQMLEIAFSEHAAFQTGELMWRVDHRVDGRPWLRSPITLADGSNTVSPFIKLT